MLYSGFKYFTLSVLSIYYYVTNHQKLRVENNKRCKHSSYGLTTSEEQSLGQLSSVVVAQGFIRGCLHCLGHLFASSLTWCWRNSVAGCRGQRPPSSPHGFSIGHLGVFLPWQLAAPGVSPEGVRAHRETAVFHQNVSESPYRAIHHAAAHACCCCWPDTPPLGTTQGVMPGGGGPGGRLGRWLPS